MRHPTANLEPIPVLLYHRVALHSGDRFAVTPDLFAEHVDVLSSSGRVPVTIGEVAAALRDEADLPARLVAITFDDGFDDTPAAIACLGERGLRATVYVTTGWLGQPGRLTSQQLRELAATGETVEIGAHTVSHPRLDELDAKRVQFELAAGKETLEDLLGKGIGSFAYPYGVYDRRVRAAVIAAGFSSAAAVKNAISHAGDDPWAVARYTITNATSPALLAHLLEGKGAPYAWQRTRIRTHAYRAFRRTWGKMAREP